SRHPDRHVRTAPAGHPANHFHRRRAHAALRPPAHAEHRVLSPDVMSAWHTPGSVLGARGATQGFRHHNEVRGSVAISYAAAPEPVFARSKAAPAPGGLAAFTPSLEIA